MINKYAFIRVLSLLFAVNCVSVVNNALAIASYEDEVEWFEVAYKNGSSISILCANDVCGLRIKKDGIKYKFSSKEMNGVPAYPSNFRPVLFSVNNDAGQFSFEVQLDCKSSGFPEGVKWPCFGNYLVAGGRLERIHKYVLKNGVVTHLDRL